MRRGPCTLALALAIAVLPLAPTLPAQTVDLRIGTPGTDGATLAVDGVDGASILGQSFTIPTGTGQAPLLLESFSFYLFGFLPVGDGSSSARPAHFQGVIRAVDGSTVGSEDLFRSDVAVGPSVPEVLEAYTFRAGFQDRVMLRPGRTYLAYLDLTGVPQPAARSSTGVSTGAGQDVYDGGMAYQQRTADGPFMAALPHLDLPLVVRLAAVQSTVPEPSAFVLVGSGVLALGAIAAGRRRRR